MKVLNNILLQLQKPPLEPGHEGVLHPHGEDGSDDEDGAEHVRHVGRAVEHGRLKKQK